MNAKAVLTFTFLVLFGNYAVIGESFVELAEHNCKIRPYKPINIFSYIQTSVNYLINNIYNIAASKEYFLFYYVQQNFYTNWMSLHNFDVSSQDVLGFPVIHILTRHSIEAFLDLYNLCRDQRYEDVLAFCSKDGKYKGVNEYNGIYKYFLGKNNNNYFTVHIKHKIATNDVKGCAKDYHLVKNDWFPTEIDLLKISDKCNKYAHPNVYLTPVTAVFSTTNSYLGYTESKESILRELLIANLYIYTNSYFLILQKFYGENSAGFICRQCTNPLFRLNDKNRCVYCLRQQFESIVNSSNLLVNKTPINQSNAFYN